MNTDQFYNTWIDNKKISSIGFGMYRGADNSVGDTEWQKSLQYGISKGINIIDTAQKYRSGRSEKLLSRVLDTYLKNNPKKRKDLILISKAGLLSQNLLQANILEKLKVPKSSFHAPSSFCIDHRYISWSVDESIQRMGTPYIDGYLLHNVETALLLKDGYKKIILALQALEKKVDQGKISYYGISSWNGLRRTPESKLYLPLEKLYKDIYKQIGKNNRFKVIEAPLSVGMPAVYTYSITKTAPTYSLKNFLFDNELFFLSSASAYEGKLKELLNLHRLFQLSNQSDSPEEVIPPDVSLPLSENSIIQLFASLERAKKCKFSLEKFFHAKRSSLANVYRSAINLVRSTDFVSSALIGMENLKYTKKNLELLNMERFGKKEVSNVWNSLYEDKYDRRKTKI